MTPRGLQQVIAALTTSVVRAAIVFVMASLATNVVNAQSTLSQRKSSLSLEANPFRGTLSYAHFASERWELGAGVGFGFPQIDLTLFRGKRDDFRDYAHVGVFARRYYGKRALLELGLKVGAADYQPCMVSDCWPRLYVGPSVFFGFGGEHFKFGPRLTFGEISHPAGDVDVFASVSPLNVMASWRW